MLVEREPRLILAPVLTRLAALRAGYVKARKGDFTPCDEAYRRLIGLLIDDQVAAILDPLLEYEAARRRTPTGGTIDEFRNIEEALASAFGMPATDVRKRMRSVRSSGNVASVPIASTTELVTHVHALHEQTKQRIADGRTSRWKGRFAIKRTTRDAETVLVGIGTIIADATFSSAFKVSYLLGTAALSQGGL